MLRRLRIALLHIRWRMAHSDAECLNEEYVAAFHAGNYIRAQDCYRLYRAARMKAGRLHMEKLQLEQGKWERPK